MGEKAPNDLYDNEENQTYALIEFQEHGSAAAGAKRFSCAVIETEEHRSAAAAAAAKRFSCALIETGKDGSAAVVAATAAATSTKGATFRGFDQPGATRRRFAEPGSTHDLMVYHTHFVPAGWNKHIDTVAPVTRMLGQPSRSLTSPKLFARVATALRAAAASVCAARVGWGAVGDKEIRRGFPAAVLLVLMIVLMLSAPAEATALGVNTSASSPFTNVVAVSGFRRMQAGPGCELGIIELSDAWGTMRPVTISNFEGQSQECRDYWAGMCQEVVVVPEGVTEIPTNAMYSCSSLTTVTISDSVETIGELMFAGR
jgi:hypothetical protein